MADDLFTVPVLYGEAQGSSRTLPKLRRNYIPHQGGEAALQFLVPERVGKPSQNLLWILCGCVLDRVHPNSYRSGGATRKLSQLFHTGLA